MTTKPKSEFLVISRGQWDKEASKETIQQAIDDFYVWLERCISEGTMKTGSRLGMEGATVSRKAIITDGPFGEAKEAVGGYWFILADNLEDAAKLAANNPCMKCGLFYEIRPTESVRCSVESVTTESPNR